MRTRQKTPLSPFASLCFHQLETDIKPPKQLNNPFNYQPHPLAKLAMESLQTYISEMSVWQQELSKGKMFGVLVTENQQGQLGFLAAYSGQIGGRSDWPGFVPAVFDYLQPDGYFKIHEQQITEYNILVEALETDADYRMLKEQLKELEQHAEKELSAYRESMQQAKRKRDELRQSVSLSVEEQGRLVAESQHMKAEGRRLKQRLDVVLANKRTELLVQENSISQLKAMRKQLSDELQRWLFSQFMMRNARGEQRHLLDIFASTPQQIPPAGAGECCAPKLLQHAYIHHLKPVCMAEFWWGASPKTSIRHHGVCYPACRGKCLPILSFMLQGLKVDDEYPHDAPVPSLPIIYEDDTLVVVDKPAGLLSVPGRSGSPSVVSVFRQNRSEDIRLYAAHRLDMATSGLLILAKDIAAYRHLQAQFKAHAVDKEYIAVVEGTITQQEGVVDLPLRPDLLDRPRQVVDPEKGKSAITSYRVLSVCNGKTLLSLRPITGRTHQLRMHCAHQEGLQSPILGDELYGHVADRLYLHAASVAFVHPVSGQRIALVAPVPNSFIEVSS